MKEDKYASTIKAYSKMGVDYLNGIDKLVPKEFFDFIKLLPKKGLVLDAGCAGGRDSKKFVAKGFGVIGIDLVDVFLKQARKIVSEAKFKKMDLLNLNFPANKFDGIWASAVLLHIKRSDILTVLKNFYKVLKPGGKIFIMVKKGKGISYKTDKLSKEKRLFVYYSVEEIKKILNKAGYKIIFLRICKDDAGRDDTKWIRLVAEK